MELPNTVKASAWSIRPKDVIRINEKWVEIHSATTSICGVKGSTVLAGREYLNTAAVVLTVPIHWEFDVSKGDF